MSVMKFLVLVILELFILIVLLCFVKQSIQLELQFMTLNFKLLV